MIILDITAEYLDIKTEYVRSLIASGVYSELLKFQTVRLVTFLL